jgi:hypothetical protein
MKPAKFHHPEFKDLKFSDSLVLDEEHASNLIGHLEVGPEAAALIYEIMDGKEINTARELLQFIGTDVIRTVMGVNYWVDQAEILLKSWLDRGVNVVFTDVRFSNERDLVKDYRGSMVAIVRKVEKVVDKHSSEVIDFPVDIVIKNDGDIDKLGKEIKEIVCEQLH